MTRATNYISLLILSCFFLLAGCSKSLQTGYDYDSSVNLRQFKTFSVDAEKAISQDPLLGSDLNRRRLSAAVVEVMTAKGYVLVEENPDIVVKYMTDMKERQQVRSNNNYSPYWWAYGPMMNNSYSTYTYQESRFILNIYQESTRKMVWQGWASGQAKGSNKEKDREEAIKNIMADILLSFPKATLDTYRK